MKRFWQTLIISALCFLGAAVVTQAQVPVKKKPGGGYFIQYNNEDNITIHTTRSLTNTGISTVMFFHGDEPSIDRDAPSLLVRLAGIRGLDSLFLQKYEISVNKRPDAQWDQILPAVLRVLRRRGIATHKVRPEQRDLLCKTRAPLVRRPRRSRRGVQYSIDCPPNPDTLDFSFGAWIFRDGHQENYQGFSPDPSPYEKRSRLLTRLSRISGVDGVYIQENELHIDKGAAHRWTRIQPQVLAIMRRYFGRVQRVELKHKPNWAPYGPVSYKPTAKLAGAYIAVRKGGEPPGDRYRDGLLLPSPRRPIRSLFSPYLHWYQF